MKDKVTNINSTLQEAYDNNDKILFRRIIHTLLEDKFIAINERNVLYDIFFNWEEYKSKSPTGKIDLGSMGYKIIKNKQIFVR